jgi:hypothetical protein
MSVNDPRLLAFNSQLYPIGLDLGRCVIQTALGVYQAASAATFRAGSIVAQNTSGQIVQCTGDVTSVPLGIPFGVAKWNKATSYYAAAQDEEVTLVGTTVSNLKHANLFNVSSLAGARVTSGPSSSEGTVYTESTNGSNNDYVVNYTNGTLVRTGGSTITDGQKVYIDYLFQVSDTDADFQGRNFFNQIDDVTLQDGRITVITNWSILFTAMFDPSVAYAYGAPVYGGNSSKAGLFTSTSGSNRPYMGRVFQTPSASDPYLGVQFAGQAPAV